MMRGERDAPLEVVLEEGSDEVKASEVSQGSDGGGGTESCDDSNVGATGGVAGTPESWASK